MKLEELYENISKDFIINELDLGKESTRTSNLFIKYVRILSDEKIRLKMLENNKKNLLQEKRDYYSGNAPASVYQQKPFSLKLRSDSAISKYIDADPEVLQYNEKIFLQEQKVEILYATMDEIKRRGYAIKGAIEWAKYMSGA